MNLHHAMPGWIPFGICEAGGGSLKWFKDELCAAEQAAAAARQIDVYDILNAKAAAAEPGVEGLLYFPYLMGERLLGSPYRARRLLRLDAAHRHWRHDPRGHGGCLL